MASHLSISAKSGDMIPGPPQAPRALNDAGCVVLPPVVQPGSLQIAPVPLYGLCLLVQLLIPG